MSFYGNILNRIDRFISSVKTQNGKIEITQPNVELSLLGKNGIETGVDEAGGVVINGAGLAISLVEQTEPNNDGYVKYELKQGDSSKGTISVPLGYFPQTYEFADKQLTIQFSNGESNASFVINLADLVVSSDAIKFTLNYNGQITANIADGSIKMDHLTQDVKNELGGMSASVKNGYLVIT